MSDTLLGTQYPPAIYLGSLTVKNMWVGDNIVWPRTPVAEWITLSDNNIVYRKGVRDGQYVIDYSSNSGSTWEYDLVILDLNEESIIILIDAGVTDYRQTIRTGSYVIDHKLNETGFNGIEGVDWENVYMLTPTL